jgi:hypothetical protein
MDLPGKTVDQTHAQARRAIGSQSITFSMLSKGALRPNPAGSNASIKLSCRIANHPPSITGVNHIANDTSFSQSSR